VALSGLAAIVSYIAKAPQIAASQAMVRVAEPWIPLCSGCCICLVVLLGTKREKLAQCSEEVIGRRHYQMLVLFPPPGMPI
jgi:uncharacterized membrane protein YcfT